MLKKLFKFLFRLLVLLFILGNIVAFLHGRKATQYHKGDSAPKPFKELQGAERWKAFALGRKQPRPKRQREASAAGFPVDPFLIERQRGKIAGWQAKADNPKGVFLLLPDYNEASDQLFEVGKSLHSLGYHLVAIDFAGTGESSGDKNFYGNAESRDVEILYKEVRDRYPNLPISIYAKAKGAGASLKAQFFGRIEPVRVILECPPSSISSYAKSAFRQQDLPEWLSHPVVFWGGLSNRMNPYQYVPVTFASGADCPVLLLRAQDHPLITVEDFEQVSDNVSSKLLTAKTIAGADGSQPLVIANPAQWLVEVNEFLRKTAAADSPKPTP